MRVTEDVGSGEARGASPVGEASKTIADALAGAIARHGCSHLFGLMGDGNMHLFTALPRHGVEVVEVRHESGAVAMAEGYGWTSGGVGFCSVTHGPGLTHTATSLVVAARNNSPLVMLLAETPDGYLGAQHFDQELFVRACEAPYVRLAPDDDPVTALDECVRLAIERTSPVVLAVPAHLFDAAPGSTPVAADTGAVRRPTEAGNQEAATALGEALAAASRPVLIAGRGALTGRTAALMTQLAERYGAALATTVPAKGLFDGHPYDLGISGGLSHRKADEVLRAADLVVAVGSSLDRGTTSSMRLFAGATVLQLVHELVEPSAHANVRQLFGDAEQVLDECLSTVTSEAPHAPAPWFPPLPPPAECWEEDLTDFDPPLEAGTVDPRRALAAVSETLPADAVVVVGNGHCSGFATTFVQVPDGGRFFAAHGFGSIGQALTSAIGAALGAPGRKVVVFEGDAAFMMHLQEVDTAARAGANLTAFVLNDQALGTEYQRLLAEGDDADLAAVRTPDLAAVAGALGARSRVIADASAIGACARDALAPGLAVVEVRTARSVLSRHMRWIRRTPSGSAMD